jgi:hypothetical protein
VAVVYLDWCNHNEQRSYPLAHSFAGLPDNLLVDMSIRIPRSAGTQVYLASAVVSPSLVTLTFVADNGVGPAVPVGAVRVLRPVVLAQKYPIEPFYPGAGGWVALGSAATTDLPVNVVEQIPVVPRVQGSYDDLPLRSIGKMNKTKALTGIVELRGQDGVQVLACTQDWPLAGDPDYIENPRYKRLIDGLPRRCIAVRLEASPDQLDNLYDYTGPCQKSPQDDQCGRRLLQTVNGVGPDCDGNLTIEFEGVPNATLVDGDGNVVGLTIDYPLGLIDVCDPDKGLNLPQPADLCEASSQSSMSSQSSQSQSSQQSSSSVQPACPDITEPTLVDFVDLTCWEVPSGTFTIQDCQLNGTDTSWGLAVLIGSHTVGHDVQAFLKINSAGAEKRAYLVFGAENQSKFWFLELNAGLGRVIIGRRSGSQTVDESLPFYQGIALDTYVHVRVAVSAGGYVQAWINGVAGPVVQAAPSTLLDGRCGLAVRGSTVLFDHFALDWPVVGPGGFPPHGC